MARTPRPPAAAGALARVASVVLAHVVAACGSTPASDVPDGEPTADTVPGETGDAAPDIGDQDTAAPTDADDTSRHDVADDTPQYDGADDTGAPDTPEDAVDTPADPPVDSDAPDTPDAPDSDWGDPCEPPIRMRPTSGSTAGGTLVEVAGHVWYIGALDWWLDLDDRVLGRVWVADAGSECSIFFVTQPAPAGPRDAYAYYGGPEGVGREDLNWHAGVFTFVDEPGPAPGPACGSDTDCDWGFEACYPGIGACVANRCASASCGSGWIGGPCHTLRGCVDPGECDSDDDCRLLFSPCSCVAVPTTDPRDTLDPCLYDGCAECDGNTCAIVGVEAVCRSGVCVEIVP